VADFTWPFRKNKTVPLVGLTAPAGTGVICPVIMSKPGKVVTLAVTVSVTVKPGVIWTVGFT
jgi:hypothetical protein